MKNYFILDTNVYRYLAQRLLLKDVQIKVKELKAKEQATDSRSFMSIVVTMELLKHLDVSDPFFEVCFKALAVQFFHTQSKDYGEDGNEISFIPPLNTLVTKHFFSDNNELYKYYLRIIEIAVSATKNLDFQDFVRDKADIEIVAQQLFSEREEMKENLEDFIKSINNGVLDWTAIARNKGINKQLRVLIKDGTMLNLFAVSLITGVRKKSGNIF